MIPKSVPNAKSLVTTHDETVKGFVAQANQKKVTAAEVLKTAKQLSKRLGKIKTTKELEDALKDASLRDSLITAAGLSEKAKGHLTDAEMTTILYKVYDVSPTSDVRLICMNILYSYLLTKGDSLGGSIRNWVGAEASRKIISIVISTLKSKGITPKIVTGKGGKVQYMHWGKRILIFDKKPKFINKSVDIILIDNSKPRPLGKLLEDAKSYLACGELKGGIDPAGADEHWKTANKALDRIRTAFAAKKISCPELFFVAAAIESEMAKEIFTSLTSGTLGCAANLTNDAQLKEMIQWLVNL